jgi:hypothetical protein
MSSQLSDLMLLVTEGVTAPVMAIGNTILAARDLQQP